ncbi:hypothetical protein HK101_005211 [Irineochytrium annulatum]|nr:hypothetical protein HK101_005211 [Irineochytrium annulatum]
MSGLNCPYTAGQWSPSNSSELQYAQNFKIQYHDNYLTLDVPSSSLKFLLYLCNINKPAEQAGQISLQVPPSSDTVVSAPNILPYLHRLDLLSKVKYAPASALTNQCVAKLASTNITTPPPPSDPVMAFGDGSNSWNVSAAIASEANPLAAAEWITFFAAFYGPDVQAKAQQRFADLKKTYTCLTEKAKAGGVVIGNETAPVIGGYVNGGGNVWDPPNVAYWKQLAADAGASWLELGNGVNKTVADWKTTVSGVDLMLELTPVLGYNEKTFENAYGIKPADHGPKFMNEFSSYVYRMDRMVNGGFNDFPESHYAQPDLLLAEMMARLSPAYHKDFTPYWSSAVFVDESGYPPVNLPCPTDNSFVEFLSGNYCVDLIYAPSIGRFSNVGKVAGSPVPVNPTATPVPSTDPTAGNGSSGSAGSAGLGGGAIIGIVAVVLVVAAVVALGVVMIRRKLPAGEGRRRFYKFALPLAQATKTATFSSLLSPCLLGCSTALVLTSTGNGGGPRVNGNERNEPDDSVMALVMSRLVLARADSCVAIGRWYGWRSEAGMRSESVKVGAPAVVADALDVEEVEEVLLRRLQLEEDWGSGTSASGRRKEGEPEKPKVTGWMGYHPTFRGLPAVDLGQLTSQHQPKVSGFEGSIDIFQTIATRGGSVAILMFAMAWVIQLPLAKSSDVRPIILQVGD